MEKAKTLGTNSLAGLVAAATVLGPLAYNYFPSKDEFRDLDFKVKVHELRLNSAFGPLKFPTGSGPSATGSLAHPNVVYAAEEPQAQEKLEAYRKALGEHGAVLPQSFISKCQELGVWKDDSAGYKFEGADGGQYNADQTILCIIRLMGYK